MGSAPIGCTKPFESNSTRRGSRSGSASAPTTFGSAFEGTARQIRSQPASSKIARAPNRHARGQLDPRQVVGVLAVLADSLGLLLAAGPERDVEPAPREQDRERRAPTEWDY